MTSTVLGSELRINDTLEVWWSPNRDTIIGLRPYTGPLAYLWKDGAQIAEFALNKSGMTIDNSDFYMLLNR